jgi:hypothetical protein
MISLAPRANGRFFRKEKRELQKFYPKGRIGVRNELVTFPERESENVKLAEAFPRKGKLEIMQTVNQNHTHR